MGRVNPFRVVMFSELRWFTRQSNGEKVATDEEVHIPRSHVDRTENGCDRDQEILN
ncbi:hypothetical protein PVK06_008453 [Gossypium arboreum]|uniref:Uncharacterized protein n=1 Tax=Gossypium arboreum TaxID=29729 RepID=A0ABR0QJZ3_GOSAR|nr:hypothetical protein PVK06_008453 [Gossypium arboreum]